MEDWLLIVSLKDTTTSALEQTKTVWEIVFYKVKIRTVWLLIAKFDTVTDLFWHEGTKISHGNRLEINIAAILFPTLDDVKLPGFMRHRVN